MTRKAFQRGRVAVVIVNYRTAELTLDCVREIRREKDNVQGLTVLIVDGGSADGSADRLREGLSAPEFSGWTELLPLDLNGGFGWANNQAILRLLEREDRPDFIHLLNPDSRIEPGAIAALAGEMVDRPKCGVAGSQLINPDASLAGSAFRFPNIAREFVMATGRSGVGRLLGIPPTLIESKEAVVAADWVTGASCMFRTEALIQEGLFDHGFFLYFEEVELMARLKRAGWDILHVPASRVMHIGGAATGIHEGKFASSPAKPRFWYESRRRFHALAYGRTATALAGVAWLLGDSIRTLSPFKRPGSVVSGGPSERKALCSAGLFAKPRDLAPAFAKVGDPLDTPPAWMSFEQS